MTKNADIIAKVEAYLKANPTSSKAAALKALKIRPGLYYRHMSKANPKAVKKRRKRKSPAALHAEVHDAITRPVRKSDKVIVMVVDADSVAEVLAGLRS